MTGTPAQDAPGPERWRPFSGLPVFTMAINITLIAVVFLTRNRWDAWIVERTDLGGGTLAAVLAVSRDSHRAVLHRRQDTDHDLVLWDIETSRRLATYRFRPWHSCFATFSPDGKKMLASVLAADGWDETALIDVETGERLAALAGARGLRALANGSFSPDGRAIVSAGGFPDGYARVWSASDGSLVLKLGERVVGAHDAEFSPSGGTILTSGPGVDVRLWDARTGAHRARLDDHDIGLARARFCAGGRNVFICVDGRALLVEAASGAHLLKLGACYAWAVSDTGGELAVYDERARTVAILDAASGGTLLEKRFGLVRSLDFTDDGDRLLARRWEDPGNVVTVLDPRTGEVLTEFPCNSRGRPMLSPDGARVLTYKPRTMKELWPPVQVYSTRTGGLLAEWPEVHYIRFLGNERIVLLPREVGEAQRILRRVRPEWWWGVAWLWHFWVIAALVVALAVSIRRDVGIMRRGRAARAA
jgi:WD40 repeat protein